MKAKLVKQELSYILFDEKGILIGNTSNVLNNNRFSKLSIKNCQTIERGYDLNELAEEIYPIRNLGLNTTTSLHTLHQESYKAGFQKALELMGDKKYSEDDLLKAFTVGVFTESEKSNYTKEYEELLKSIQPNEWEVEFNPDELDADGCLILKRI